MEAKFSSTAGFNPEAGKSLDGLFGTNPRLICRIAVSLPDRHAILCPSLYSLYVWKHL